jgi:tRNA A37 threonylcarbamoyltransferase TsaD
MLVLGIESTAHTFGVGITDGKEILANEKRRYHFTLFWLDTERSR